MPSAVKKHDAVSHSDETKAPKNPSGHLFCLWLPLSILFSETLTHIFYFGISPDTGLFFRAVCSLAVGAFLTLICLLLPRKAAEITVAVILGFGGLFFSVYHVYYTGIHSFFSWQVIGLAGDVVEFWRETLMSILWSLHKILLSFLPFVLFLVFRRRAPAPEKGRKRKSAVILSLVVTLLTSFLFAGGLFLSRDDFLSLRHLRNDIARPVKTFGVVVSSSVDLWQSVFGAPEEEIVEPPPVFVEPDPVTEYNVLDIDFENLIANETDPDIIEMHEYFKDAPATEKNEYTGLFKGKNLIFLSLEAFSYKAIDPVYTPTLYKMYNEGFKFTNFYATLWGGSTATGEYSNMTGNFYTTADCLNLSADTNQYFAFGNLFSRSGYNTFAYHNHTYTYYGRDRSHPNFGFPNFKAIGNGLSLLTESWPRSDLEMGQVTFDEYAGSAPFMTYYMTVSGHANFSWSGNNMALRHKNDINPDLTCGEFTKAYLATQQEVELMLSDLISRLEAAGQLENTVFAMCCDHLPYALDDVSLGELYSLPSDNIRNNYDLYRNAFILWSPSMEAPVTIDTPCSNYDMLPTLANLFGLPYDSRLITGKDILSDTEKIVLINTLGSGGGWNWITTEGTYNTVDGSFTPSAQNSMTEEEKSAYVELTQRRVAAMRKYSFEILDRNYYSYIFK